MRFRGLIFLFLLLPFAGQGQLWLGGNAGSLAGRTADAYVLLHPKNQDWLALSLSGGYTLPGPLFLPHNYADLSNFRHSGYHVRLGAKNFITSDHLSNHLFWGGHLNYAGVTEKANNTSGTGEGAVKNNFGSLGVQFDAGYSICLNPNAMRDKWKLDLGLQLGFPVTKKNDFMGAPTRSATYVPGLGYGRAGEEAVNFQLIVLMRYMMWDGRYGYQKLRKTRYNRRPKKPKPMKPEKRGRLRLKGSDDKGGKGDKAKKDKSSKKGNGGDSGEQKPEKPPKEKKKKKNKENPDDT